MSATKNLTRKVGFLFLLLLPLFSQAAAASATAIFAGGCFWSMQHDFDRVVGVLDTTVGYTGGTVSNPTYDQVSGGNTGHYEAIKVTFDPSQISYRQLLDIYWHDIDPTDAAGEFCDHGSEYRSVIFYRNATQKKLALESKESLIKSKRFNKIYTQILPAMAFYPAEEYHQKYAEKNPESYAAYRKGCRRDETLKEVWSGS